ncbi:MAG: response regulator [Alphaproteobacteria bacterium]|nr:response regulator [Alphaproteobacteria bacterium]
MEVLSYYNPTRFLGLVPKIKTNMSEWWVVDVALTGETAHNVGYITLKLKEFFKGRDGAIFICNRKNILVFAHLGNEVCSDTLSHDLHGKMPKYSCAANISEATTEGLSKMQLRLGDIVKDVANDPVLSSPLFQTRKERKEKIFMVAEDDMFMRSIVTKNFEPRGKVYEFPHADGVVETYLEHLPDIVFLDIHLPSNSGMNLLQEILSFDPSAYVVIMSADSVKENVLGAKKSGAKGFLAKPFNKERLDEFYGKCPSIDVNAV